MAREEGSSSSPEETKSVAASSKKMGEDTGHTLQRAFYSHKDMERKQGRKTPGQSLDCRLAA